MSSINQDIKFSNYGTSNNPYGLFDFIKPTRHIKGNGVPLNSQGEDKWIYTDESSGQQYTKENGEWQPYIDFSTFGGGGGPIPDPLPVAELNTDLITGLTSDSVEISAGVSGDINFTLDPLNHVNINGNIMMRGNGNIYSGSEIKGFQLTSDNGAGNRIEIQSNSSTITNYSAAELLINNTISGENIRLRTLGIGNILVDSNMDLLGNNITECAGVSNNLGVNVLANGGDLLLYSFSNVLLSSPNISFQNNPITDIPSINGSNLLTDNRSLSVLNGSLDFRPVPTKNSFYLNGWIGNNTTQYFSEAGAPIGPADFFSSQVTDEICTMTKVSLRVFSNAIWEFGGGTATLNVAIIPRLSYNTIATFNSNIFYTVNLDTATTNFVDFFSPALNISIPSGATLACRVTTVGCSTSLGSAEASINIWTN